MNNLSVKLLSILSACNPKDEALSRESKLQSILASEDYKYLAALTAFSKQFRELFAYDCLKKYTDKELATVVKVLPIIPTLLEDIAFSLVNGAGPYLTASDRPNFMDPKSLNSLSEKLKQTTGKNYCNIAPNDYMDIFDTHTIKDIHDDFYKLPADCTDYDSAIRTLYPDKKYCISASEVKEKELEYEKRVNDYTSQIEGARGKKKRRLFLRIAIGLLCILLPVAISRYTSLLSSTSTSICVLIEVILALAFIVRG